MYGRTYGRSVVMVAAFRRGLCFRSDARGVGNGVSLGSSVCLGPTMRDM